MSFIHYLFLGYFERDGEMIRFTKNSSDSTFHPALLRPLEPETVASILQEADGDEDGAPSLPKEWPIWIEDGYLICDKYIRNAEALDFVTRLVRRTGCDIYDVSAHCNITLEDWLTATHTCAKS
jgi:hypothetical protein